MDLNEKIGSKEGRLSVFNIYWNIKLKPVSLFRF